MILRPILFNTPMVKAIRSDIKLQTRRLCKERCLEFTDKVVRDEEMYKVGAPAFYCLDSSGNQLDFIKAPWRIDEVLYVRETFDILPVDIHGKLNGRDNIYYRADGDLRPLGWQADWRPSLHMKKIYAREFLKITNVRLEKLQDVTEEEAYLEGVMKAHSASFDRDYWYYKEGQDYLKGNVWTENARQCFLYGVWNSTISKSDFPLYNCSTNPWVWVIEFKRIRKEDIEL